MKPAGIADLEQQLHDAMDRDDWDTAAILGRRLDDAETADKANRPTPSLAAAALWYAQQGMPVFPLQPGCKIPWRGSHGLDDATTDPGQIRDWWRHQPDSNVGVATGHTHDVIDIDGPDGVISWARLDGLPPILGRVSTPRPGGHHLYVAATGLRNGAGVAPGIDIRGTGGYVVVPPAINLTGRPGVKHPGVYRWAQPLAIAGAAA